MMEGKEITLLVNGYCGLRDRQYAVYTQCAKRYNLTTNELFFLDILWFSKNGCTQKAICKRLSMNKQTISAIVQRFYKKGYICFEEVEKDKRNKLICFTNSGKAYAENIIPPAAEAEIVAMTKLGIENLKELVNLTTELTENMEQEFLNLASKQEKGR